MPYMSVIKKSSLEFIVKVNCNLHKQNILEYLHSEKQQSNHVIVLNGMCLELGTSDSTTYPPTHSRTDGQRQRTTRAVPSAC